MKSTRIPLFRDINDLHELTGSSLRTSNPSFHCFDMSLTNDLQVNETSPHRADFCTLALNINTENLEYTLNQNHFVHPSNFILCVAPGQITSWNKKGNWYGYCTFFKPEFLNYQSPLSFLEEFPFFNLREANLITISPELSQPLVEFFNAILREQQNSQRFNLEIIRSLFQTVLWHVRRIYESSAPPSARDKRSIAISAQYHYLVNEHFLHKITVEDYAALLNISANHLSQTVMDATGVPAKKFISSRRLSEANYLLRYTNHSVTEISEHLGFSEPTHFIKFFKKESGLTPARYRDNQPKLT